MDLQFEEAPCNIDEVITMNYSFDNLHKFLNFLLLNDKDYFQKLKNISIKLLEMEDIKENLNQANVKIANFEQKFTHIDGTINSFYQRFNELDLKITTATSVKNIKKKLEKTLKFSKKNLKKN